MYAEIGCVLETINRLLFHCIINYSISRKVNAISIETVQCLRQSEGVNLFISYYCTFSHIVRRINKSVVRGA